MGRTPSTATKDGLNRGAWTSDEDQILRDYVKNHGEGKWGKIAKRTGLKRCGKSCRLRWLNYLRPDIKRGNISQDEEDLIVRLHKLLGNRWSLIAGRLPGRTDNEIKNYWNTTLRKKAQAQEGQSKTPTKKLSESNDQTAPSLKVEQPSTETAVPPSPISSEYLFSNKEAESDTSEEINFTIACKNDDAAWKFMMDVNEEQICPSDFPHTDFAKLCEANPYLVVDGNGLPSSSNQSHQFFYDENLLENWTSESDFLFE